MENCLVKTGDGANTMPEPESPKVKPPAPEGFAAGVQSEVSAEDYKKYLERRRMEQVQQKAAASQAGVPVELIIRGICSTRKIFH